MQKQKFISVKHIIITGIRFGRPFGQKLANFELILFIIRNTFC